MLGSCWCISGFVNVRVPPSLSRKRRNRGRTGSDRDPLRSYPGVCEPILPAQAKPIQNTPRYGQGHGHEQVIPRKRHLSQVLLQALGPRTWEHPGIPGTRVFPGRGYLRDPGVPWTA